MATQTEDEISDWMEELRKQYAELARIKDKDFDLSEEDARFLRDYYPMLYLALTSGPMTIRDY